MRALLGFNTRGPTLFDLGGKVTDYKQFDVAGIDDTPTASGNYAAWGIRHAAETWARVWWELTGKSSRMACIVTAPDGSEWPIVVYVEYKPSFHAVAKTETIVKPELK